MGLLFGHAALGQDFFSLRMFKRNPFVSSDLTFPMYSAKDGVFTDNISCTKPCTYYSMSLLLC